MATLDIDMAEVLRDTIVALIRRDGQDMTARQLAVLLTCYLSDGPHTVRGLAAGLNVSKPAITRALDRLGELDFVRRKTDPLDRRSVLAQRTAKGSAFMRELGSTMATAVSHAGPEPVEEKAPARGGEKVTARGGEKTSARAAEKAPPRRPEKTPPRGAPARPAGRGRTGRERSRAST
jgi:DNA-binding MarR family transcriptional regulator